MVKETAHSALCRVCMYGCATRMEEMKQVNAARRILPNGGIEKMQAAHPEKQRMTGYKYSVGCVELNEREAGRGRSMRDTGSCG